MVSKTNLGGSLAIIPYLVNRYFSGTKIVTGVGEARLVEQADIACRVRYLGCRYG
jgi:hypothetical protein